MTVRASRQSAQSVPHKMFLWDPTGVYLDYWVLNPIHGHFVHPQPVVGAHVRDVLVKANSRVLQRALAVVRKSETAHAALLTFQRDRREYQSMVQCVPTTEGCILGVVVDILKPSSAPIALPCDSSRMPWPSRYASLTKTEKTVLTLLYLEPLHLHRFAVSGDHPQEDPIPCVRMGLSNKEIARLLSMTVRTIKFHVTNIYAKLQVGSPHQSRTS